MIRRELGRGAMGVVYEGFDESLNRKVALKAITGQHFTQQEYVDRFMREAQVAAQVIHPNLVAVYSTGCDDGRHYIAMEFVDGKPLSDVMKAAGKLRVEEALCWVRDACEGLAAIHEVDIIHRDIKPANLLLDNKGRVKITDYGLAKPLSKEFSQLTMEPIVMGTIPYMSPEQCMAAEAVPASDLFALGVTLYEMLCGELPLKATSIRDLMEELKTPLPRVSVLRPDVSPEVDGLVAKFLAVDLKDRFAEAKEAISAIDACMGESATIMSKTAVFVPVEGMVTPASRRKTVALNVIAAVVFIMILVLVGGQETGRMGALWHTLADTKYRALPEREFDSRIQLVAVENWTVPQKVLADMVAELHAQDAAVIGMDFTLDESSTMKDGEDEFRARELIVPVETGKVVLVSEIQVDREVKAPDANLKPAAVGFANMPTSPDLRNRRALLHHSTPYGDEYSSFAVKLAKEFDDTLKIPDESKVLINFGSAPTATIMFRADDVQIREEAAEHEKNMGKRQFDGKIVILGAVVADDKKYAPLWDSGGGLITGLELQGIILDNILNNCYLKHAPWWLCWPLVLILAAGCMAAAAWRGFGIIVPVLIAGTLAYLLLGALVLRAGLWVMPAFWPLMLMIAVSCAGAKWRKRLWPQK